MELVLEQNFQVTTMTDISNIIFSHLPCMLCRMGLVRCPHFRDKATLVALWGKGVLFREVSSFQRCPYIEESSTEFIKVHFSYLFLNRRGGRIILACRSKERGERACEEVCRESGSEKVFFNLTCPHASQSATLPIEFSLKKEN